MEGGVLLHYPPTAHTAQAPNPQQPSGPGNLPAHYVPHWKQRISNWVYPPTADAMQNVLPQQPWHSQDRISSNETQLVHDIGESGEYRI
jgi:hypothetical protein